MNWRFLICVTVLTWAPSVHSVEELKKGVAAEILDALDGADDSKLQSLLRWAIEHSDPEYLKATADAIKKGGEHLDSQKERVRELSDFVSKQISESDLMKEAVGVLKGVASTESEVVAALESLQVLVERIDNANDLQSMDGIMCLANELKSSVTRAAAAARVIGVAAANNPTFQTHLYTADPKIISELIDLMKSKESDMVSGALYAVSSLIRHSENLRTLFYSNGGLNAVHQILEWADSTRLKRKCLTLLTDLVQLGELSITDHGLVKLIVQLVKHADWDLSEKAMSALSLLCQHSQTLKALKQLNLGQLLSEKRSSVEEAAKGAGDRAEYFQELLTSIDTLIQQCQAHEEDLTPSHTEL